MNVRLIVEVTFTLSWHWMSKLIGVLLGGRPCDKASSAVFLKHFRVSFQTTRSQWKISTFMHLHGDRHIRAVLSILPSFNVGSRSGINRTMMLNSLGRCCMTALLFLLTNHASSTECSPLSTGLSLSWMNGYKVQYPLSSSWALSLSLKKSRRPTFWMTQRLLYL